MSGIPPYGLISAGRAVPVCDVRQRPGNRHRFGGLRPPNGTSTTSASSRLPGPPGPPVLLRTRPRPAPVNKGCSPSGDSLVIDGNASSDYKKCIAPRRSAAAHRNKRWPTGHGHDGRAAEAKGNKGGRRPAAPADKTDDVHTACLEGGSIAALAREHGVSRGAPRTAVADLMPDHTVTEHKDDPGPELPVTLDDGRGHGTPAVPAQRARPAAGTRTGSTRSHRPDHDRPQCRLLGCTDLPRGTSAAASGVLRTPCAPGHGSSPREREEARPRLEAESDQAGSTKMSSARSPSKPAGL